LKQFLALCVMATLVGCGPSFSPSEAEELGTIESAICGKGSCPSGSGATSYYCDSGCPNSTSCGTAYNAATCAAYDLSGPISLCGGNCPSGYYVTQISETADCRPGSNWTAGGANRRDCAVSPAPGAVPSYSKCSTYSTCGTGYRFHSNIHLDACYFAGLNATLCVAL